MRILVATGIYPPQIGGPATYSKLLYDELPRRGIEVEVVNFGDFLDLPWFIRHFRFFRELSRRMVGADIVFAQDPVSVGLPALFASQLAGKPFVLKIVGDYAWEQGRQRFGVTDNLEDFSRAYVKYPWQVKMLKKIEKYVADGARAIITPSNYLRDIVTNWGVDSRLVKVIYNGVNPPAIPKTPSVLKRTLSLKGPTVITVGRLVPWKGVETVIRSMVDVHVSIPDATLVIVGDGPDRSSLEGLVEELNLGKFVRFTGDLSRREALEYVKASDVFVLNTSYEGFSHQLIETMMLGTPVVTTSVGGNAEIVRNDENALIIPINDTNSIARAITLLLSDDSVAARLSRVAKKDASKFTDTMMLDELVDFLRRISS